MSDIYLNISDVMRQMAGLSHQERKQLMTEAIGGSSKMTIEQIQDLARAGKLRMRAFGEDTFYGIGRPFSGNLERAADGIPHAFSTGMVALYYDADGIFIGPSNPKLVDTNPFEGCEYGDLDP